jgi:hypothetical protein
MIEVETAKVNKSKNGEKGKSTEVKNYDLYVKNFLKSENVISNMILLFYYFCNIEKINNQKNRL